MLKFGIVEVSKYAKNYDLCKISTMTEDKCKKRSKHVRVSFLFLEHRLKISKSLIQANLTEYSLEILRYFTEQQRRTV